MAGSTGSLGSEASPSEVREGFWRMQKPKLRSCQAKKGEKEHRQSVRKMLSAEGEACTEERA